MLSASPEVVAIFSLIAILLGIIWILPRGLDFSDTGFYYASIFNLPQIDMQTTQFSVVWRLFAFSDSILLHRVLKLGTLIGAAFMFAKSADEFIGSRRSNNLLSSARYLSLAVITIVPLYTVWLPDPSYNSLGFTLLLAMFALAFRITCKIELSAANCKWELILAGLLAIPLLLTRPMAPAFVIVTVLPLVWLCGRPRPTEMLQAIGWIGVGLASYIILQTLLIEPLWVTYDRFLGGMERRELISRPDFLHRGAGHLLRQAADFGERYLLIIIAGIFTTSFALAARIEELKLAPHQGRMQSVAALALLLCIALTNQDFLPLFLQDLPRRTNFSAQAFLLIVTAVGGCIAVLVYAITRKCITKNLARRLIVVAIALILGISAFFGTQSGWLASYFRYSGVLLAALCVACFRSSEQRNEVGFGVALLGCVVLCLQPIKNLLMIPYRLPAAISAQTEAVPTGRGTRMMRVDPATRDMIATFSGVRNSQPNLAPRRQLVDLSGRLPMVAFQLGAKTHRSAWVLSGYPGSQALFDYTYQSVDASILETAWILEAPLYERSLSPQVLFARGLDFPDNYRVVAATWSGYLNSPLILWEPINQHRELQP